MTIYYNDATDKNPAKLNINFEKLEITDTIDFSEATILKTDSLIAFYGVLTESCVNISNYKNKEWRSLGKKAFLSIHKDQKDVWDNSAGKYNLQPVHKDEHYLFVRLESQFTDISEKTIVAFSTTPYINPIFDQLVNQNNPALADTLEAMVSNVIRIHARTTQTLTDEDIKLFNDYCTKLIGDKKFGTGTNYKSAETEAVKLEARLNFLKQQCPMVEFTTLGELAIVETGMSESDQILLKRTIDLINKMWGYQ